MPSAYTPGLLVRTAVKVRRERRLAMKGRVLVKPGDVVQPSTVIACAEQPGEVVAVKVASLLGMDPAEATRHIRVGPGVAVKQGDLLAEAKFLWGLLRSEVRAPVTGVVEYWSQVTGNLGIRLPPKPVQITAFLGGRIVETIEAEGAVIEASAAVVQGVLGVGGEGWGEVVLVDNGARPRGLAGKIAASTRTITRELIDAARSGGAAGLLGASISDEDLTWFVGEEIGAAVTGEEKVPFPLVVTEGFGTLDMSRRAADVLSMMAGKMGAISGRTQIRAGAVRPELIVPVETPAQSEEETAFELSAGKKVRLLRPPYFGSIGEVVDVPHEPEEIAPGSRVPVVRVRTADGLVTVPRANVELIA